MLKTRVESKGIKASTLRNNLKPIKLFCEQMDIDRAISEMKRLKKLPTRKKIHRKGQAAMEQEYQKYKPNYSGIKRVFAINVIRLAKEKHDNEYNLCRLVSGGYLKQYVLVKKLYLNRDYVRK